MAIFTAFCAVARSGSGTAITNPDTWHADVAQGSSLRRLWSRCRRCCRRSCTAWFAGGSCRAPKPPTLPSSTSTTRSVHSLAVGPCVIVTIQARFMFCTCAQSIVSARYLQGLWEGFVPAVIVFGVCTQCNEEQQVSVARCYTELVFWLACLLIPLFSLQNSLFPVMFGATFQRWMTGRRSCWIIPNDATCRLRWPITRFKFSPRDAGV